MPLLVPPAVSAPVDPLDLVRRTLEAEVQSSQVVGKGVYKCCVCLDRGAVLICVEDAFCTVGDVAALWDASQGSRNI